MEGGFRQGEPQGSASLGSANAYIGTFQTGRHYKVHKSYMWVAPIVAVVFFLAVVFFNGLSGWMHLITAIQRGELNANPVLIVVAVIAGLIIVVGAFVGLYALAWRNMSYVFDEREFSYYSGIITKRRVHVPYARVQSVNHRASIIQRLFGVCTVAIDSAGGSSNKAVRVPYLQLSTAERLRAELFMRKAAVAAGMESHVAYIPEADTDSPEGAQAEAERVRALRSKAPEPPGVAVTPAGASAPNKLDEAAGVVGDWRGIYGGVASVGEEPVSYEYGLTNRELAFTTISHDTPIMVAVIVFLMFAVMLAFMLLLQDEVATAIAAFSLPIVVGCTLLTWLFGLASVALSYGNFRARRRGSRIEVERGLLARDFSGIDIQRVQSVEVRQSFIRRLIGYCELSLGRIDAVGEQKSGNNNSKGHTKGLVIHPFVRLDRVDEIVDGLAPELADRPRLQECKPLPKPALRRALLRRCVWYNWALWTAVAIGICWGVLGAFVNGGAFRFASATSRAQYDGFMTWTLIVIVVLCVAITVARGFGAVLWANHSGYAWNRNYLLVCNDGLRTSRSLVPRGKIQAAATRSNPFQRRLSLVTLQAATAIGTRSTTVRLLDIPEGDGDAYLDWVKPRR